VPLATGEISYLTRPIRSYRPGRERAIGHRSELSRRRRRGMGRDLLARQRERGMALHAAGLRRFRDAGCARAGLGVDAEPGPTGAVGRYERLGFHTVRTTTTWAEQVGAQGLAPSRVGQS